MPDRAPLLILLSHLHSNQLAVGAAVEELAIWVEQHGSAETALAVKSHLSVLNSSSDDISRLLARLT